MRKNIFLSLVLFCVINSAYCEKLFFPPEMKWWILEIQKSNIFPEVEEFELESSVKEDFYNDTYARVEYNFLKQWNCNAEYFVYLDQGATLEKNNDGRYEVYIDIDSSLMISTKETVIFRAQFGSSEWLSCAYWLNEKTILGIGLSFSGEDCRIVVIKYVVDKDGIIVSTYMSRRRFTFINRENMKLYWFDQRPDLFIY